MRRLMFLILMAVATTATAQQLDLKVLDKIAAKATSKTEMSMDEDTLKAASKALDDKKGPEAAAKKSIDGMKGFFLRSYEFKKGDFKIEDIKPLVDQLKAPNWVSFLSSKEANEQTEIWWHKTNGVIDGMILIAAEEDELTIINGIGVSSLQDLGQLKDFGRFATEVAKD